VSEPATDERLRALETEVAVLTDRLAREHERVSGLRRLAWVALVLLLVGELINWNMVTDQRARRETEAAAVRQLVALQLGQAHERINEFNERANLTDAYVNKLTNGMTAHGIAVPDRPTTKGEEDDAPR
jgi:hypothetical protein